MRIPDPAVTVTDAMAAVEADRLRPTETFRRTYLGHGLHSSAFVFQGRPGPFAAHVHTSHDEIGYVLEGTGTVRIGAVERAVRPGDVWVIPAGTPHGGDFKDAPIVLFASSPPDDPDDPDRVWL